MKKKPRHSEEKPLTKEERIALLRRLAALLLLCAFFVTAIGGGGIATIHLLDRFFDMRGPVTGYQILISAPFAALWIAVVSYIAVVLWLAFSKLFFTRDEIISVCRSAPHTRFDIWLVGLFFPPE